MTVSGAGKQGPDKFMRRLGLRAIVALCVTSLLLSLAPACDQQAQQVKAAGQEVDGQPEKTDRGPRLKVSPRIRDMGKVREGTTEKVTYELHNEGNELLRLQSVHPQCATCLDVSVDTDEIPPGEAATVEAEYTAEGKKGDFTKYILVISNNRTDGADSMVLRGQVVPEFEWRPRKVTLEEMEEPVTRSIHVIRNFGGPLELQLPEKLPEWIQAEVVSEAETEPRKADVKLRCQPPRKRGTFDYRLVLGVNGEQRESLPVVVKVSRPAVELGETRVFFGIVPASKTAQKTVSVRLGEGVKREDVKIVACPDYMRAELRAGESDRQCRLQLQLRQVDKAGSVSGEVRLGVGEAPFETQWTVECPAIRVD